MVAVYVVYNAVTIGVVAFSSEEKSIMSMSDSCKDSASKSNDDGICDMIGKLQKMSTDDKVGNDVSVISVCANCGKEGNFNNTCNKCKQVKYCNAACKKKHRHKHKKDCEEHLRLAAEIHDEKLFEQPPSQYDDCPICFIRMPTMQTGHRYQSCCGKRICNGCVYAPVYDDQGNEVEKTCPFCRTPMATTEEEIVERYKKRMDANDPISIFNLGCDYRDGTCGYPQDYVKSSELFHRAGDLGNSEAYVCLGYAYDNGLGVEMDEKKAVHYYELAAIKGDADARANLGIDEAQAGNTDKSIKHFMLAAACGHDGALEKIKQLYSNGLATKDDYTKALQSYQAYLGEIKSPQRNKAAAHSDRFQYY